MPTRELGDIIRVLLGDSGRFSGDLRLVGDAALSSNCRTFAIIINLFLDFFFRGCLPAFVVGAKCSLNS